MTPRSRGALRVRAMITGTPSSRRGRRESQASAEACGPRATKSTRQNHRSAGRPGPPCATALRIIRSLPGDRLVCHRHPARCPWACLRNLTSASGGQNPATSPSVTWRTSARRSTLRHIAAIASRTQRLVTFAQRPSSMRRDGERKAEASEKAKLIIFRIASGQAKSA